MKKMLYFMHVPWGWIKQRPHFLATELNKYYDVTVCYLKPYRRMVLVDNSQGEGLGLRELFVLPYSRFTLVARMNGIIISHQIDINQFDFVWLSHPTLYGITKNILFGKVTLIYDCMDNAVEFEEVRTNSMLQRSILDNEAGLIDRSEVIVASSESLRRSLVTRFQVQKEIHVVNNAISLEDPAGRSGLGHKPLTPLIERQFSEAKTVLTYVGTIAGWMDWELILRSLAEHREITYFFFGPSEVDIPRHERLKHFGPIDHHLVQEVMRRSSALVMPFKLTGLIRSVDPVKLYEYIHSCRPSVAIRYGETMKFNDYVHLYETHEEYLGILGTLAQMEYVPKRAREDCLAFVAENTWEKRGLSVKRFLDRVN